MSTIRSERATYWATFILLRILIFGMWSYSCHFHDSIQSDCLVPGVAEMHFRPHQRHQGNHEGNDEDNQPIKHPEHFLLF
jgi:hypothetical protein